jgi:hypothetical protein
MFKYVRCAETCDIRPLYFEKNMTYRTFIVRYNRKCLRRRDLLNFRVNPTIIYTRQQKSDHTNKYSALQRILSRISSHYLKVLPSLVLPFRTKPPPFRVLQSNYSFIVSYLCSVFTLSFSVGIVLDVFF